MSNKTKMIAKKKIKELIYHTSLFENLNQTLPETETVIDFGKCKGLSDYDVEIILNLKRAWSNVLYSENKTFSLERLKFLNSIVAKGQALEAGELRKSLAYVGGVENKINFLSEEQIITDLEFFNESENIKEVTINFIIWSITNQLFYDGNKRTAFLAANEILINNDIGIISINEEDGLEWNVLLSKYYNDKNPNNFIGLNNFLESQIEFTNEKEQISDEDHYLG